MELKIMMSLFLMFMNNLNNFINFILIKIFYLKIKA